MPVCLSLEWNAVSVARRSLVFCYGNAFCLPPHINLAHLICSLSLPAWTGWFNTARHRRLTENEAALLSAPLYFIFLNKMVTIQKNPQQTQYRELLQLQSWAEHFQNMTVSSVFWILESLFADLDLLQLFNLVKSRGKYPQPIKSAVFILIFMIIFITSLVVPLTGGLFLSV